MAKLKLKLKNKSKRKSHCAAGIFTQKSQQLASLEAELSKLSLDKESRVLAEMERISREHRQQTADQCGQLGRTIQQELGHLTELTEQWHRDGITGMKSTSDQLLQKILGSVEATSVLLAVQCYALKCVFLLPGFSCKTSLACTKLHR